MTFFVHKLLQYQAIYDGSVSSTFDLKSRDMTSLKRHFLKSVLFNFHTIFLGDVQLLSHKLLEVSCRYLEPFRGYGEYPGGMIIFNPPPPGGARVNSKNLSVTSAELH